MQEPSIRWCVRVWGIALSHPEHKFLKREVENRSYQKKKKKEPKIKPTLQSKEQKNQRNVKENLPEKWVHKASSKKCEQTCQSDWKTWWINSVCDKSRIRELRAKLWEQKRKRTGQAGGWGQHLRLLEVVFPGGRQSGRESSWYRSNLTLNTKRVYNGLLSKND